MSESYERVHKGLATLGEMTTLARGGALVERLAVAGSRQLTDDIAVILAEDSDDEVLRFLVANDRTPPDILVALAAKGDQLFRFAASNPNAPVSLQLQLTIGDAPIYSLYNFFKNVEADDRERGLVRDAQVDKRQMNKTLGEVWSLTRPLSG